jgi:ammonium transporter, Amt family
VSRGKKFLLLTTLTLVALIAVGQLNHHADPGGPAGQGNGTVLNATKAATNNPLGITKVPLSATGMQTLANHVGHLAISINFTWLLLTGFLVLFMQVGFAFLVTGLTRAKNAGHMMMMNLTSFVVAFMAYYAVGFAFQFGGIAPIANLGGTSPLTSIFGHGSAGVIGLHGFFLQSGNTYDVGVLAFFLFQVVFMETAGYIIIGAIA